tara:strand:- start:6993 stop:8363 length:1371 start_codon:yes stop_codon:yes gene_type:complete
MNWIKTLFFLFLSITVIAQSEDKSSLLKALKGGKTEGYFRSFWMYTDNTDDLKDYNALAVGGKLKYETGKWKGFSIGAATYVSINTGISDMSETDEQTGRLSRYELGLFNNMDPAQREIVLLGEAYLKYNTKSTELTVGRMLLKTPFLNPEDGRMIPTLEQGIWFKNQSLKHYTFQLGVLNAIAPRSTDRFYSIEHSLGTYAVGRNNDGTTSGYSGNSNSDYMAIGAIQAKYKGINIQLWDYYLDNIFNTAYLEANGKTAILSSKLNLLYGAQYLRQDKVGNGGSSTDGERYFDQDESNVFGAKLGVDYNRYEIVLAANHITDDGRFLFPREWGRETLYTFQKRERTEGQSDATNVLLTIGKKHELKSGAKIDWSIGYGKYYWQDVKDAEDNKYAVPSHDQLNVDVFYHFAGLLEGLQVEFLATWKPGFGETYDNPNFILNKVDMTVYQVILNYKF